MTKKIFFAVLNMGLGHATRSLPLIKSLIGQGCRLTIGSSGRALQFLKSELPGVKFYELPDYQLEYSSRGASAFTLLLQAPKLLQAIRSEHNALKKINLQEKFELVVSDHRYGCYLKNLPALFITHQLRFIAPQYLRPFEFMGIYLNRFLQRYFSTVLVPDFAPDKNARLSGRLSIVGMQKNVNFIGPLASVAKKDVPQNIDILISISGPEPQRTIFEELVLAQVNQLNGKIVVVKGQPEENEFSEQGNLTIYSHLPREKMTELMNQSKLIVTRSGYSTMMELAALGKNALLVPTPGQTEQEYLAEVYRKAGWFHSVAQHQLNLLNDAEKAVKFNGFPFETDVHKSVDNFNRILRNADTVGISQSHIS